jgi:hypothetical protein
MVLPTDRTSSDFAAGPDAAASDNIQSLYWALLRHAASWITYTVCSATGTASVLGWCQQAASRLFCRIVQTIFACTIVSFAANSVSKRD